MGAKQSSYPDLPIPPNEGNSTTTSPQEPTINPKREEKLQQAARWEPRARVPRLRDIHPLLGEKCEWRDDRNNYYCGNLYDLAYWYANPQLHDDEDFRRGFSTWNKLYDYEVEEMDKNLSYHINELFGNEHAAVRIAVNREFRAHFARKKTAQEAAQAAN